MSSSKWLSIAPDSLPCVVLNLRLDQYVLKIDLERLSQANHAHYHPICLRFWLVPRPCVAGAHDPSSTDCYPSFAKWHSIP